jgi:hypothetical protein
MHTVPQRTHNTDAKKAGFGLIAGRRGISQTADRRAPWPER